MGSAVGGVVGVDLTTALGGMVKCEDTGLAVEMLGQLNTTNISAY